VFGEYRSSDPSRFLDEVPAALMQRYDFVGYGSYGGAYATSYGGSRGFGVRESGFGNRSGTPRGPRGASQHHAEPVDRTEDEDQSAPASGLRLGMRVRHPQFGVGTVLAIEDHGDDVKLTVRFAAVGVKRLLGRYARLERE
jgi:DNA helicase-2/ATP-dependent DNA helicase PcrA